MVVGSFLLIYNHSKCIENWKVDLYYTSISTLESGKVNGIDSMDRHFLLELMMLSHKYSFRKKIKFLMLLLLNCIKSK